MARRRQTYYQQSRQEKAQQRLLDAQADLLRAQADTVKTQNRPYARAADTAAENIMYNKMMPSRSMGGPLLAENALPHQYFGNENIPQSAYNNITFLPGHTAQTPQVWGNTDSSIYGVMRGRPSSNREPYQSLPLPEMTRSYLDQSVGRGGQVKYAIDPQSGQLAVQGVQMPENPTTMDQLREQSLLFDLGKKQQAQQAQMMTGIAAGAIPMQSLSPQQRQGVQQTVLPGQENASVTPYGVEQYLGITKPQAIQSFYNLPKSQQQRPVAPWEMQKEARTTVNTMISNNPVLYAEVMKDPNLIIKLINDEVERLNQKYGGAVPPEIDQPMQKIDFTASSIARPSQRQQSSNASNTTTQGEIYTPEQEQLIMDNMERWKRTREEIIAALKSRNIL